jgi:hypothetical protein
MSTRTSTRCPSTSIELTPDASDADNGSGTSLSSTSSFEAVVGDRRFLPDACPITLSAKPREWPTVTMASTISIGLHPRPSCSSTQRKSSGVA